MTSRTTRKYARPGKRIIAPECLAAECVSPYHDQSDGPIINNSSTMPTCPSKVMCSEILGASVQAVDARLACCTPRLKVRRFLSDADTVSDPNVHASPQQRPPARP